MDPIAPQIRGLAANGRAGESAAPRTHRPAGAREQERPQRMLRPLKRDPIVGLTFGYACRCHLARWRHWSRRRPRTIRRILAPPSPGPRLDGRGAAGSVAAPARAAPGLGVPARRRFAAARLAERRAWQPPWRPSSWPRLFLGAGLLRRLLGGFLGRLLGGFLGCRFLRRLLGRFLRRLLRGLLRRFLRRFLGGFLLRRYGLFLAFLAFLPFFLLLAFSHRDPPVAADPCLSGVSSRPLPHAGQSISSILAGDRLSPNREAQSCAPQELTCRRQSEPCIQYCPQQSCPASLSQYWRPFDRAICSQCQAGECCKSPPNRNTNGSRVHLSPRIRSWKAILSELA